MNTDIRNLTKWLNEGQEAPLDRQALARVLAMSEQPARQALQAAGTHPAPCARHCEAQAFEIAARGMRRQIAELQAALAEQPAQQQEPVVFYRCNGCGHAYEQVHPTSCDCMEAGGFDRVEYYTYPPAQRTWVGLTDVEIASACKKNGGAEWWWRDIEEYGRAIEAKLKEKNA